MAAITIHSDFGAPKILQYTLFPLFYNGNILQGEGNGTPLRCSCLENPMDGGAWWAAIYGVAQSQTRLKRHSSSSSNILQNLQNPNQDIHMDPIKMQSTFVKMRIPHVTLL